MAGRAGQRLGSLDDTGVQGLCQHMPVKRGTSWPTALHVSDSIVAQQLL
jgi:hypothetical protein